MLGRTNAGGSGSGGTLTVTGVAGDTVTVSKDGKTYSRTFNSSGIATFKGLKTGKWTVTMTGSSGTATRTVEISADYKLTMTYFSATITVTYPEGSTCTATDGTTTLSAPDTSGTWMCIVPNAGAWTVTATNGTQTKSLAVSITAEGQAETVTLEYRLYIIKNGQIQSIGFSTAARTGYPLKITENNDGTAKLNIAKSSGYTCGTVANEMIDLSKYKTLYCDGLKVGTATWKFGLMDQLSSEKLSTSSYVSAGDIPTTFTQVPSLDVSAITGSYYVGILYMASASSGTQFYTLISNFWLE